eukprot:scpid61313/ scgid8168/ 
MSLSISRKHRKGRKKESSKFRGNQWTKKAAETRAAPPEADDVFEELDADASHRKLVEFCFESDSSASDYSSSGSDQEDGEKAGQRRLVDISCRNTLLSSALCSSCQQPTLSIVEDQLKGFVPRHVSLQCASCGETVTQALGVKGIQGRHYDVNRRAAQHWL